MTEYVNLFFLPNYNRLAEVGHKVVDVEVLERAEIGEMLFTESHLPFEHV